MSYERVDCISTHGTLGLACFTLTFSKPTFDAPFAVAAHLILASYLQNTRLIPLPKFLSAEKTERNI